MRIIVFLSWLLFLSVARVNCYPTGATNESCGDIFPLHFIDANETLLQPNLECDVNDINLGLPECFSLTVENSSENQTSFSYECGASYNITLKGTRGTLRGYMVVAMSNTDEEFIEDSNLVGEWIVNLPDDSHVICNGKAVTQSRVNTILESVSFTWIAPDSGMDAKFWFTVVSAPSAFFAQMPGMIATPILSSCKNKPMTSSSEIEPAVSLTSISIEEATSSEIEPAVSFTSISTEEATSSEIGPAVSFTSISATSSEIEPAVSFTSISAEEATSSEIGPAVSFTSISTEEATSSEIEPAVSFTSISTAEATSSEIEPAVSLTSISTAETTSSEIEPAVSFTSISAEEATSSEIGPAVSFTSISTAEATSSEIEPAVSLTSISTPETTSSEIEPAVSFTSISTEEATSSEIEPAVSLTSISTAEATSSEIEPVVSFTSISIEEATSSAIPSPSPLPIVCDPSCMNGVCIAQNSCHCFEGYEGDLCNVRAPCPDGYCNIRGICLIQGDEYICQCPREYKGDRCQEGPDLTQLEITDEMSLTVTRDQALRFLSVWKGTDPSDLFYKELETGTVFVVDYGELIYKITMATSPVKEITWSIEKYV